MCNMLNAIRIALNWQESKSGTSKALQQLDSPAWEQKKRDGKSCKSLGFHYSQRIFQFNQYTAECLAGRGSMENNSVDSVQSGPVVAIIRYFLLLSFRPWYSGFEYEDPPSYAVVSEQSHLLYIFYMLPNGTCTSCDEMLIGERYSNCETETPRE